MRRELLFELKTESENRYRQGASWVVGHRKTKAQRAKVAEVLSQYPGMQPPVVLPDGERNSYTITLCRIAPGYLDDDNLRGALKAVRDEVAKWLGRDDRLVPFEYLQQRCGAGFYGVRISISDDARGEDIEHVACTMPRLLGEAVERATSGRRDGPAGGKTAKPAAKKTTTAAPKARKMVSDVQEPLTLRRAYVALPWRQRGGSPRLTIWDALSGEDPPRRASFRGPNGQIVSLPRRDVYLRGVGHVWIYAEPHVRV